MNGTRKYETLHGVKVKVARQVHGNGYGCRDRHDRDPLWLVTFGTCAELVRARRELEAIEAIADALSIYAVRYSGDPTLGGRVNVRLATDADTRRIAEMYAQHEQIKLDLSEMKAAKRAERAA